MTAKVVDFDRWRSERAQKNGEETPEAPVFRIGGKEYPLPVEPPATVALDVIRLKETMEDADAAVPLEALYRIGNSLFGADQFRAICDENSIGAAELGDLILMAVSVWKDRVSDEDAVPNRAARRAKRSTSSGTGRSSKRTS